MNHERVWVRIPNWLGDAMMARPVLHALRRGSAGGTVLASGPAAHNTIWERPKVSRVADTKPLTRWWLART